MTTVFRFHKSLEGAGTAQRAVDVILICARLAIAFSGARVSASEINASTARAAFVVSRLCHAGYPACAAQAVLHVPLK